MTTDVDNFLQGPVRITAHVESPVKGDAHALGSLHEPSAQCHVNIAIGRKRTNDHAIHPQVAAQADVVLHASCFVCVIKEIAPTRTDEHVQLQVRHFACSSYESCRRRDASHFERGAEFHTVCTAFAGCQHTFNAAGTYFECCHDDGEY